MFNREEGAATPLPYFFSAAGAKKGGRKRDFIQKKRKNSGQIPVFMKNSG